MRALILSILLATGGATGAAWADAPSSGRFVEVRGARLFVQTQGNGPPTVFLHGGLDHFETAFAAQRAVFAASRQVIGIDQRGHGHSPDDARPFDYREMAEDTAAVIEKLGVGAVDIVGQSDGADIAMLLARDHPALVRRLVLASGNLRVGLSADELAQRKNWSPEQVDERLRKMSESLPARFQPEYVAATPEAPDHWWVLLRKSWQLWLTPVIITPAELARIQAPALVIAGDRDFVTIEETVEIWRALPHAQLLILPDTGHGTLQTRPKMVNLAIDDFLKAPARAVPLNRGNRGNRGKRGNRGNRGNREAAAGDRPRLDPRRRACEPRAQLRTTPHHTAPHRAAPCASCRGRRTAIRQLATRPRAGAGILVLPAVSAAVPFALAYRP